LFRLLFAALARTAEQLYAAGDDHEDRPRDVGECPRQNIELREEEDQSKNDDEDRDYLVMTAATMTAAHSARAGLAFHFLRTVLSMIFHDFY
jgi:hypothetical protein